MRNSFTGDVDPAAALLAARLGGLPSQTVAGFGNREFDAVSPDFIAGDPHPEVVSCIHRNALRFGAEYVIVSLKDEK